ncbi:MAG: hypothetical protein AAF211_01030 [Myxococcota bacterium]
MIGLLLFAVAPAWAGITLETSPVVGQEVVIAVTDAFGDPRSGETVRVHHGPGLAAERELAVGITDGRGRIRWTPSVAGVAELQVGAEPLRVRVAPQQVPVLTLLLIVLIGLAGTGATLAGLVAPSWRSAR